MATSTDAGTFARLRAAGFKGAAVRLADVDLPRVGALIGVGEDEIHAIIDVESSGSGFDKLGRPKMLFEPHVFWRHLGPGAKRTKAASLGIAYEKWKPGNYPSDSYPRLAQALDIDVEAALMSASWGLTQILGENHADLGYLAAADMVVAFCDGEAAQLTATVALIKSKGLAGKLKAHDWAAVARGWNGPGYAANHYDDKLAARFAFWHAKPNTPWSPAAVVAPSPPSVEVQTPIVAVPAAPASSPPKLPSQPAAATAPAVPQAAPVAPAPAAGGLLGSILGRLRAAYPVTPKKV
jgi:hypothetical protein